MFDNRYNYNNQTGQFRQRIEIFERRIEKDSIGQNIETNVSIGKYWSMVKTNVNRNELRNGVERTVEDVRFVVKYSKSLSDFLNAQGTIFHVTFEGNEYRVLEAINDNELNKTLTIRVVDLL